MAYLSSEYVVFEQSGFWYKPVGLHSIEVIARGGGGGGGGGDYSTSSWSNQHYDAEGNPVFVSGTSVHAMPGPGGGGGGMVASRGFIRAEDLEDEYRITIGEGGLGAIVHANYPTFAPGGNGYPTTFGDLYYAGGGLGGGRLAHSDSLSYLNGGPGGYAPVRGGKGATLERTDADSRNLYSTISGGGGGGRGNGRFESDGDSYGNTTTTQYPWSKGGNAGISQPSATIGGSAPNKPLRWEFLQSGAGGNGGGGNGGYPSGGGGGGHGEKMTTGTTSGGNGARGAVTVIEHYLIDPEG